MPVRSIYVNELSLEKSLSRSLQDERRENFALVLAMFTKDGFNLSPENTQKKDIEAQLREYFELAAKQNVVIDLSNQQNNCQQSYCYLANNAVNLTNIHFHHAVIPEALCIRGALSQDWLITLENCDLYTRLKFYGQQQESTEATISLTDTLLAQLQMAKDHQD